MNDIEKRIEELIQIERQKLIDKIKTSERLIDSLDAIKSLKWFDEFIPKFRPLLLKLVKTIE